MQTSGPGSKPSSKGKNARFESEGSGSGAAGAGGEGISHERLVLLSIRLFGWLAPV